MYGGVLATPMHYRTSLGRRNLRLLFDASHAFGCSHNGIMIGNFGEAEVFSFHATKFFNTFEGGAIVTNNDELAAKLRLMKNFGFAGYDNVIYLGINGKLPEIAAAMGLTGLESLDRFVETNRTQSRRLSTASVGYSRSFVAHRHNNAERRNWQYVVVEIDEELAGISRDAVVRMLHAENVMARRYFYPGCHRMEPYRSLFPHAGLLLPETERVASRIIVLPTGTAISTGEISEVCQLIRIAVENASRNRTLQRVAAAT